MKTKDEAVTEGDCAGKHTTQLDLEAGGGDLNTMPSDRTNGEDITTSSIRKSLPKERSCPAEIDMANPYDGGAAAARRGTSRRGQHHQRMKRTASTARVRRPGTLGKGTDANARRARSLTFD